VVKSRGAGKRKFNRKFRVKFRVKFRGRLNVGGGGGLYIWYIVLWIGG
jgi:hypothetical protein